MKNLFQCYHLFIIDFKTPVLYSFLQCREDISIPRDVFCFLETFPHHLLWNGEETMLIHEQVVASSSRWDVSKACFMCDNRMHFFLCQRVENMFLQLFWVYSVSHLKILLTLHYCHWQDHGKTSWIYIGKAFMLNHYHSCHLTLLFLRERKTGIIFSQYPLIISHMMETYVSTSLTVCMSCTKGKIYFTLDNKMKNFWRNMTEWLGIEEKNIKHVFSLPLKYLSCDWKLFLPR